MRTKKELLIYAKKNKLDVAVTDVASVRKTWEPTAVRQNVRRPTTFQNIQIPQLGMLQMDYANFHEEWSQWNGGFLGFTVCVCSATGLMTAVPFKNRKMSSFEDCCETIIKSGIFPSITTICSDRESAVFSDTFQEKMLSKFGIRFAYLSRFSKAWQAERAISTIKRKLSTVMDSQLKKGGGKFDSQKWLTHLATVLSHHNSLPVPGTKFIRSDVNDSNFLDFLDEKMATHGQKKLKDATMLFNTRKLDQRILPKTWLEKLFSFKLGDQVFASRASMPVKNKYPAKATLVGNFKPDRFIISQAQLRSSNRTSAMTTGKKKVVVEICNILTHPFSVCFQFTNCGL